MVVNDNALTEKTSFQVHKIQITHLIYFYCKQYYSFRLVTYGFDPTFQFSWIYNDKHVNDKNWNGTDVTQITSTIMQSNEKFLQSNISLT